MPRTQVLLVLVLFGVVVSATPVKDSGKADFKAASKQLVSDLRDLASRAKSGLEVKTIAKEVLDLQSDAADLIQQLSDEVAQCETDLVIKMAAAGTGSHEVLTLMLADSELDVLNGRLSLSLAFLERVAQQLEDELALSHDVGAQLAAVVFGTNATATIAESADAIVPTIAALNDDDDDDNGARRRDVKELPLSNAWSVGLKGDLKWRSSFGRATVLLPSLQGVKDGAALKRGSGTRLDINPSYNKQQGLGVTGSLKHEWGNGRGSWHVSPSWSQRGGWGVSAGLSFRF